MIGHNNGPPLDGPDRAPDPGGMRYYAWKKAHRAAFRAPSVEQMKIRTARANAVGLTYTDFTATLLDRGRNLTTLIFTLKGVLARLTGGAIRTDAGGAPLLMPGVREKLAVIRPEASFVAERAESEAARETLLGHIARIAGLTGFSFTGARVSDRANEELDGLAQQALQAHGRVPAEAVLVGDTVEHERAAARAQLGRFVWSWRYFGERPQLKA